MNTTTTLMEPAAGLADEGTVVATLARLTEQMNATQAMLSRVSADRLHEAAAPPEPPTGSLSSAERIVGAAAVIARLGEALRTPHRDAVWLAAAGPALPLTAIGRGQLPVRILVRSPSGLDADELPVRVAAATPEREVLVVDRSLLLIPYRTRDAEPALAVGRQPRTGAVLQAVFEALWSTAVPIQRACAMHRALHGAVRRDILGLLAAGATDDTIARQLGISKRTCARHVAQILACTGASSRFQAGMLLARFGDAVLG
jgi:hypothetical protein